MQKDATGELFTEAQQKMSAAGIWEDAAEFWCSDLQNRWDTGNKFLV